MNGHSLSPPWVTEADKPLRRIVAMAYRATREAGKEERDAFEDAMTAYNRERPGEERLATSARVAEMIASAVRVDPVWFWKNVRKPGMGQGN
jgi:Glu-tRNA(Gln) amidotransferase subunit E-like FAD-binding protein